MPIYEYVCMKCGKEFEAIQKFSDPPLTACQCSKEGRVQRKLSLTAFHLHGGGWYNEGYSQQSKAGDNASSGAKQKGAAGGEAKSAPAEGGAKSAGSQAESATASPSTKAAAKPASSSTSPAPSA